MPRAKDPPKRRIAIDEEITAEEKKIEEQMLALQAEKLAKERKDADCTIIFMDPSSLDDKARAYWEITRTKILARESDGGCGV
jgi:hypothetical protein